MKALGFDYAAQDVQVPERQRIVARYGAKE
jgi:hypothetical protein